MEKKEFAKIQFDITYDNLRQSKFAIVNSPFTFTKKQIYRIELDNINQALNSLNANALNVISYTYISGMVTPYMVNQMMTIPLDGYSVVMTITYTISEETKLSVIKEQIRLQFLSSKTIDDKRKTYKRLMIQHHPDKGGNLQIAQFINTFKTW